MEWGFDGRRNIVTELSFNYVGIADFELEELNDLIAPLERQALGVVLCADGAMEISFVEVRSIASTYARMVTLNYVNGEIFLSAATVLISCAIQPSG